MGYFNQFNQNKGISFMDGRVKANLAIMADKPCHIDDFAFLKGDDGDYAVVSLMEAPTMFFFANSIITDMLHHVDDDNMRDELKSQTIVFSMHKSKKGRDYMGFEFQA